MEFFENTAIEDGVQEGADEFSDDDIDVTDDEPDPQVLENVDETTKDRGNMDMSAQSSDENDRDTDSLAIVGHMDIYNHCKICDEEIKGERKYWKHMNRAHRVEEKKWGQFKVEVETLIEYGEEEVIPDFIVNHVRFALPALRKDRRFVLVERLRSINVDDNTEEGIDDPTMEVIKQAKRSGYLRAAVMMAARHFIKNYLEEIKVYLDLGRIELKGDDEPQNIKGMS